MGGRLLAALGPRYTSGWYARSAFLSPIPAPSELATLPYLGSFTETKVLDLVDFGQWHTRSTQEVWNDQLHLLSPFQESSTSYPSIIAHPPFFLKSGNTTVCLADNAPRGV